MLYVLNESCDRIRHVQIFLFPSFLLFYVLCVPLPLSFMLELSHLTLLTFRKQQQKWSVYHI